MRQTGKIFSAVTGGFSQMLERNIGQENSVNLLLLNQPEKLLWRPPQGFINQNQTAAFTQGSEYFLKGDIEAQRSKLQGFAGARGR
ncbi:hypothetical protein Xentx_03601 [Xenorhabdus thuongxuanensis]|uniref:Uncharacterized protein n=1 Tax=Xenorhabdus thuongxuanensis TaxID=1873484 RepID=A0A1Q5TH10_9GAMM|nr:hypothetical protein Xentx_03601 [Xenorhabdus thuongxuanensis]